MQQDETQRGDAESGRHELAVPAPTKAAYDQPVAETPLDHTPLPRRLLYLPAYRYVFENREWFPTIVFATVFSFLPVLGMVAMWGYSYEILEWLHRRPNAPYPTFEFRKWGEYCIRGVWPFILAQLVGAILAFVFQVVYQVTFQGGLMLWLSNPQAAAIVTAIVAPVLVAGLLLVAIGVYLGTAPFLLRAGLTQDIRLVFRLDWIKGYWKRVWVEQILACLFQLAAMAVLRSLGCMLFAVGYFAAFTVLWIAGSHIQWQLYEIYLERGGEPIQLHPLPAEAPPAQVELPRT